jgi:hypothetical protein
MRYMKMSYDRIGNTRVRDKGKKRNIFDKVNEIKNDIGVILPHIESVRLIRILSKIRTYIAHKKKGVPLGRRGWKGYRDLAEDERIVYEYLLKNDLNPSTTYRWFIATRLPSDVKEKMANGQYSFRKAMQISANRRKAEYSSKAVDILEEIKVAMRGI